MYFTYSCFYDGCFSQARTMVLSSCIADESDYADHADAEMKINMRHVKFPIDITMLVMT
jgi:hypothetical protein